MSVWGALAGGFLGTVVLTTTLRAASELRLTRMDIPFLLGTAFSEDRRRAKAVGYVLHFLAGARLRTHVLDRLPRPRRSTNGSKPITSGAFATKLESALTS